MRKLLVFAGLILAMSMSACQEIKELWWWHPEPEQDEELSECEVECQHKLYEGDYYFGCVRECEGPSQAELEKSQRIEEHFRIIAECELRIGYPYYVICGDQPDVCGCADDYEAWAKSNSQAKTDCLAAFPESQRENLHAECSYQEDSLYAEYYCGCLEYQAAKEVKRSHKLKKK